MNWRLKNSLELLLAVLELELEINPDVERRERTRWIDPYVR